MYINDYYHYQGYTCPKKFLAVQGKCVCMYVHVYKLLCKLFPLMLMICMRFPISVDTCSMVLPYGQLTTIAHTQYSSL